MENKICKACLKDKPIKEFYKTTAILDGYMNTCKKCKKEGRKIYREYPTPSKFNIEYAKSEESYGRLSPASPDDYRLLYDFLSSMGYDVNGDVHQQFLDKWNPKVKGKQMKYKKRSLNSQNVYLPNGEKNLQHKRYRSLDKEEKNPTD
jgi:hypothetical protein